MPVISITEKTHSKLKEACKENGVKLTYAAEQAVLRYLRLFFTTGGSTDAVHKTAK